MAVSAVAPAVVTGRALGRARRALATETRRRHVLAGEVAVADLQLRRMSDRVGALADARADAAAELETARRHLRQVRVELATARGELSGAREDAARARAAAAAAVAAREELRVRLHAARAETAAATEAVRRAEAAGVPVASRPLPIRGQRSFASVDLRVFDAFTEADMGLEDAALDAPARRGRHAADPVLEPRTSEPSRVSTARSTVRAARDVA